MSLAILCLIWLQTALRMKVQSKLLSRMGQLQTQELVEAENAESEQDRAWREYLTASVSPAPAVEVSYVESPVADVPPPHTTSLRKQAMSRKRDMRPKFHAKPKLRVRK